jgi:hypothetical protein
LKGDAALLNGRNIFFRLSVRRPVPIVNEARKRSANAVGDAAVIASKAKQSRGTQAPNASIAPSPQPVEDGRLSTPYDASQ